MTSRLSLFAAGLALTAGLASAADWPQWRGPDRTGISPETGLLSKFEGDGPKLAWKFEEAGTGYSSFAVVGDRLFSMGQDEKEEFVFALDTRSGKQVWKQTVGSNYENGFGGGPRCTPTVDGDFVYVLSANGDLACLGTKDGKIAWQTNLQKNYKGAMMSGWGYSESPLIDGDLLLCCPGGDDGHLAAFDKKDGKLKWRSTGLSAKASYSSIIVSNAGGVRHYVQLTPEGLAGFSTTDGKVLWKQEIKGLKIAVIPTPISKGDIVYATSDYGAGCAAVKLTGDGSGGLKVEQLYANKDMENHHGGVVLIGDHVYGSTGNANNRKSLPFVCQDLKTGKVVWSEKDKIEPSAIIAAEGVLYCYGQTTGTLACVKATPEGFKELGRFKIAAPSAKRKQGDRIWPHPAIANGRIYLRDQEMIYCYELKPGATAE